MRLRRKKTERDGGEGEGGLEGGGDKKNAKKGEEEEALQGNVEDTVVITFGCLVSEGLGWDEKGSRGEEDLKFLWAKIDGGAGS